MRIEQRTRLRLLELAARELLESETNGSMMIGAGEAAEPLMVTAVGCSVLLAFGRRSQVLMPVARLRPHAAGDGPQALAEGCDRALRFVNRLPADFVMTLSFDVAANASRFLDRLP